MSNMGNNASNIIFHHYYNRGRNNRLYAWIFIFDIHDKNPIYILFILYLLIYRRRDGKQYLYLSKVTLKNKN